MDEQVQKIIETLNHVYEKPSIWVGINTGFGIVHFIQGFQLACALSGVILGDSIRDDNLYENVVIEHGWEYSVRHVYHEMEEKGWDGKRIAQELITIEIEVLKRRYNIENKVS